MVIYLLHKNKSIFLFLHIYFPNITSFDCSKNLIFSIINKKNFFLLSYYYIFAKTLDKKPRFNTK